MHGGAHSGEHSGEVTVTDGGPRFRRDPAEIAAIMDLRAKRAIDHVTGLGYRGMFSPVRHKPEIWCPCCDSRPRHRLLKLWMDREMVLPAQETGKRAKVLHFAAEPWVRGWFEERGAEYVTADINEKFELQLDITAMDLPDASFDLVPMIEGWDVTHEDPALKTEAELRLHYGDPTHLRFYGRDVRDRIRAPGFELHEFVAVEPDVSTHALHRGERIFVGLKPAVEGATDG
jgi:hypothetical protein